MAFLTFNKCCWFINLRIGSIICALIFLYIKLKRLEQEGEIVYEKLWEYIYLYRDEIYVSYPSRQTLYVHLAFGITEVICFVIEIILSIMVLFTLFTKRKFQFVRCFYEGIFSTNLFMIIVSFTSYYLVKNEMADDFENTEILIFFLYQLIITTVIVIFFSLVTRSYYHSIKMDKEKEKRLAKQAIC